MKSIFAFLLVSVLAVCPAWAGGPAAEFPSALIESVEKTPNGWTATVTGEVRLFVTSVTDDAGGKMISLFARKAILRVPAGSQLYALKDQEAYERRLAASVGKKELIQIWGAMTTVEGGVVTSITAGDISFLRPRGNEAAFDVGRLNEIATP